MHSRLSFPLIAGFFVLISGFIIVCVIYWGGWLVPKVKREELGDIVVAHSDFLLIEELDSSSKSHSPEAAPEVAPEIVPGRSYWFVYSPKIPRLYSAPLNNQTWSQLNEIAVASETDQIKAGHYPAHLKWIQYAVEGEREAARAISFDYAKSRDTFTEALAWAMIANAIEPNEYYLAICSAGIGDCNELVFVQASIL